MRCTETPRLDGPPYPERLALASKRLLDDAAGVLRQNPAAVALAGEVLGRQPEHRARIEPAAQALGADPLDLMLATLSYDLMMGLYGCSTVVLATARGPVAARNMDWSPTGLIARASCVAPTAHGLSAGFVGAPGVVTGLSHRGFCVILNAVGCDRLEPAGCPVLLFLRRLIDEARDFDEAVRLATATPLLSSALLTLAGTRNDQRVVVERSPRRAAVRRPEGERPLVTTNHYVALADDGDCCERFRFLARRAAELISPDDETLLELLQQPPLFNAVTAQHVVMHPASGRMRMWVPTSFLEGEGGAAGPADWLGALLN
jgi:hypothetical protein